MSFKQNLGVLRVFCVALALLMLAGCLLSCDLGKKPEETSGTTEDPNQEVELEDFGEYVLRAVIAQPDYTESLEGSLTGDVLQQATYARTANVTLDHNFTVTSIRNADPKTAFQTSVDSGRDDYDIFGGGANGIPDLAIMGYLWDLYEVRDLNLDASYYDQSTKVQGSFAGRLFGVSGDLLTGDELNTFCLVFNHSLLRDVIRFEETYGKTLYQVILDGEWTLALMEELCANATKDLNGDGVMDSKDRWGFHHSSADILAMNISMGNNLFLKNEDDVFELNLTEKQLGDLTNIIKFYNSESCIGHTYKASVFPKGQQLFGMHMVGDHTLLKDSDVDFGYAPFPKANKEQTNYYSFTSTYGPMNINIARTVPDENMVARMIELLSIESQTTLTPVLYDYLLSSRTVERPEDVKMVEIILNGKTYELSYMWRNSGVYESFKTMCPANNTNIKSAMEGWQEATEAAIDEMLRMLKQNY